MNNNYRLKASNYKLNSSIRYQYMFQSICLDDLIPEDHRVRFIWDFVSQMDLTACLEDISSYIGSAGRSSIDPKILMTLWLYTIIDGNTSARKLEELCQNHDVYKWICGGVSVNRTTLAEFRSINPKKFDDLLVKCLAVMVQNDLISDSDFSQDGTRIKANAGNNSFRREDSLKDLEEKLTTHLKNLQMEEKKAQNLYERRKIERKEKFMVEKKNRIKAAIESLEGFRIQKVANAKRNHDTVDEVALKNVRASTTDLDVRRMKMGDGGFRLAYNVQFATGLDTRVIYGVDVVNTLDPGTPPRLMAYVQECLKKLNLSEIKSWIADAAYSSKHDVITAAQLFPNCFYYAPPQTCKGIDPKKTVKGDSDAVIEWRKKIDSKEANKLYKLRCSTAEFSNMQVKNHGLREFSVRGLVKVRGMAFLHAIAENILRTLDLLKDKLENRIF